MGSIASSSPKPWTGICVTLDVFGTLYHPKKPIAVQYLEIARRCGLKADIEVPDLEASFRKAFKNQSAGHPNYGKAGGRMTVESWWNDVIYGAFRPLCRGHHIPDSLGPTLFQHFSSRDGYALYPDVVPFLESMRKLREKYTDPRGPRLAIGVITNSDDRALTILESLGLKIGSEGELSRTRSTSDRWKKPHSDLVEIKRPERRHPFLGGLGYNPVDDINFLVTSYETGYEKPDPRIFEEADRRSLSLWPSRWAQSSQHNLTGSKVISKTFWKRGEITRIHVGDDLKKDYQGAKDTNRQALHLRRDKEDGLKDHEVSNLLELATFINVIVDAKSAGTATNDNEKL